METPYVTELVRRMRLDNASVTVDVDDNGAATIVWSEPDIDHPLVLLVRERHLVAAVAHLGGCRDDLWPDSTVEAAGFNLLLDHLDEVVAMQDGPKPLRITAKGIDWPPRDRWWRRGS